MRGESVKNLILINLLESYLLMRWDYLLSLSELNNNILIKKFLSE